MDAVHVSYTEARDKLSSLLEKAVNDRETIIIQRRGWPDVALIAADELSSLVETAHLLRSPANAQRLFESLAQALRGEGIVMTDEARAALRAEAERAANSQGS